MGKLEVLALTKLDTELGLAQPQLVSYSSYGPVLKVAGALTNDPCSLSSIFLEGKVLTYSSQLPY